jgi:hypothetical protein
MVPDLEVDPKIDHTAVSLDGNKDPLVEVWNYFHQETDQPTFYTFTSTRRRQAEKRFTEALKKVKDGDPARAVFLMKCAIDAIRDSKWHNGKNPEKQNYVSWESVFGTAEKFEEWLRRS